MRGKVVSMGSFVEERQSRVDTLYSRLLDKCGLGDGLDEMHISYRDVLQTVDRLYRRDREDDRVLSLVAECVSIERTIREAFGKGVEEDTFKRLLWNLREDLYMLEDILFTDSALQFLGLVVENARWVLKKTEK